MLNHFKILFLSLLFLLLAACQDKSTDKIHEPEDIEGFILKMQASFASMAQLQSRGESANRDSIHMMWEKIHKDMYYNYPVLYDWWLQDGRNLEEEGENRRRQGRRRNDRGFNEINWFNGTLSEQLSNRLHRLNLPGNIMNTPEEIAKAFKMYIDGCIKRREQRLASFIKNSPEIVFTKFEVLRPSFFAYTEGLSDARSECNFFPGGELSLIKMNGIWAREETLLSDSLGVFRDPDVHFDGKHILFSWKKSLKEDDFHLYEMEMPTKNLKQITDGLGFADIEPVYLPDENILFNSTRSGNSVDCWTTEVSNMYICDREGRYMRRVGYDQVHTSHPAVLDDGRVVYTRWDYNDRGQVFTQPLFQMNPDGTGQTEYYGVNSFFPTTAAQVRQIPGTRKIMATFMGHHTPQHGKLGIIDPEAGRDEAEGVTMLAPVRKARPERIDAYGQYGDQFQYPYPLSESEFLVSYSPLGYYTGRPIQFGIYWMNADGERELLAADPNTSCNQPVMLVPRERPFRRINTVDYTKEDGVYYMQNIYEGNAMEGVEPGTIKKLRIVEVIYRPASIGAAAGGGEGGGAHAFTPVGVGNASWDLKRVIGTVDVNADGSAFFKVPARRPFYFQALDENNRVVQTMRSWSTLQPGETQSCVGCHEHKNTVPISSHPISMAMNDNIQSITAEGIGERNFSYRDEVQPIWDAKCISCHDGIKHKMSLKGDLKVVENQTKRKYSDSYLNLTHAARRLGGNESWQGDAEHPEVNWVSSLSTPKLLKPYPAGSNTSNLIKRLENGHKGVKMTKEELETIALWLDLAVPFISEYKEANNWTQGEIDYYDYYAKKGEDARKQNEENIRTYIESLTKN
ncbi:MAG: hypothetical protein LBV43_15855 [Prevotella sp.]|jgi:hypothetical protein|nr:hypothetical protein [Prevotella sp.]